MTTRMHKFEGEFQGPVFNCKHCNKAQFGTPYHLKEPQYGCRIEHNHETMTYRIRRPATDERAAVDYTVSELEVMKVMEPWKDDDVLEKLFDEHVDEILRPTRRRAAIEHTRRQHGS